MKKRIKVPKDWEDPPGSFERFERLARALVAVPKKELDKQLRKKTKSIKNPKAA